MDFRETAEHIFLAGIRGVLPGKIINDLVSLRGSVLRIGNLSYDLERFRNIYVIGAGKASAALAHYVENILGRQDHRWTYRYKIRLLLQVKKDQGHRGRTSGA